MLKSGQVSRSNTQMPHAVTARRRLALAPGWPAQLMASPSSGRRLCRPAGATRGSRWPPAAAILALTAAMAGCGGGAAAVSLPPKGAPAATGPPAAAPPLTARQQVAAAYAGYWQAYAAAMTSQNPVQARAILAPYNPAADIPEMIRSLQRDWAAHDVADGSAVPHVLSIQVAGRTARLHDCLDLSHFGVEDIQTSQVVAGSFGQPQLNFYITLVLLGGRWRVSNMQLVEVPCAP
jgi:hypothetical protein